jgi:hypothetical protein
MRRVFTGKKGIRMTERIDKALRDNMLWQLRNATNQPLRHDPEEHPFWQGMSEDHIPEKIVVATGSYRKIFLFALQFLLLNREQTPDFFNKWGEDPLVMLAALKKAFSNGNGESQQEMYIGELFGVPMFAQPTKGEKNQAGLTQYQEARNKAQWLARNPYRGEYSHTTWYIGVDTLDGIWEEKNGQQVSLGTLPKPSSWTDCPADWQTNSEALTAFKNAAIKRHFRDGYRIEGVTAGVLVDSAAHEMAVDFLSIDAQIDVSRLREVIDQFDPNASAFGILQLLIDFNKTAGEPDAPTEPASWYPKLAPEQRKYLGFFMLAQIMGAPAGLVIELVARATHVDPRDRNQIEVQV